MRPSKLSPETQRLLCKAMQLGAPPEFAAALVDIDAKTLYRWRIRGRSEPLGPYAELARALDQAEAIAENNLVLAISRAAQKHWRAAAWLLARRWPTRWGKRREVAASVWGAVEAVLEGVERHMTQSAYLELLDALGKVEERLNEAEAA